MPRALHASLLVLVACGSADPTDDLFRPDDVIEVSVTMDPEDFFVLRNQTRALPDVLQGDCLDAPFPNPYDEFRADVVIDGVTYTDVGIKKKGFLGSGLGLDSVVKPGLKLDPNELVANQTFSGLRAFVLNNSVQDPNAVRTCLAYRVLADAGVPAPRCNHAHVTVNGEDLGTYVHIEDVDDQFLESHFARPDGTLYKGTLSDFRAGWLNTFDVEEGPGAPARLDELAAALDAPVESRLAAVEAIVDLDSFLTIWAAESLLRHWDGYAGNTNNFFVYDDPETGRFVFLPWGTDQVMQGGADAHPSVYGTAALANRLYQISEIAQRYDQRLREVLDAAWDEPALDAEITRVEGMLGVAAPDVRLFVDGRRNAVLADIAAGPPPMDPNLRDTFCFPAIGHLSGTFSTTWGTATGDPWASGTGTLAVTLNGTARSFTQFGATAGPDPNDVNRARIALYANQPNGRVAIAVVSFLPWRLRPGETLHIDWNPTDAVLFEASSPSGSWTPLGHYGIGNVVLESASNTQGAQITGTFDADLVPPPQ